MTESGGCKKRNWLKIAMIGVALAATVCLIIKLWPILTPFFFAVLFAYVLRPILARMTALGIPSSLSIIIIYFYLFFALYLFFFICMPIIITQFR